MCLQGEPMAQAAGFPWGLAIIVEAHQHLDTSPRKWPERGTGQNEVLLLQGVDEEEEFRHDCTKTSTNWPDGGFIVEILFCLEN